MISFRTQIYKSNLDCISSKKWWLKHKQKMSNYVYTRDKMTSNETKQNVFYEEALASSKEYFGGDELAASVWINKYALKDSYGNIYEKP